MRNPGRRIAYCLLAFLTILLCVVSSPGWTTPAPNQTPVTVEASVEQGRALYESERFAEAAAVLEQAVQAYQSRGDSVSAAIALSNLSLVYQQLGDWTQAEAAIASSLEQLQTSTATPSLVAQALDIQGRLQLAQGQAEQALETWQQSAVIYRQLADQASLTRNGINQAEALQALGLYRRSIAALEEVTTALQNQPDSLTQVVALRSLGDALRIAGSLDRATEVLQQSLAIAQRLQLPAEIAASQLSLGNAATAQADTASALQYYQQAATTGSALTQAQAQLNQFRLLIALDRRPEAEALLPSIQSGLDRLPPNRSTVYAQVNFARSLQKLSPAARPTAASRLAIARQQAQRLGDIRAESFALGHLGALYEAAQKWTEAEQLTQQALNRSQQINGADITYLWQWQLGRILKAEDQVAEAIAAYEQAVATLRSLRNDLVALNADVQFSFRAGVEPVYRELVGLLLSPSEPSPENLEKARETIESLQLAELDNFFREACLNAQPVQIDEIDRQAAVIYPIILEERLEVIVRVEDENRSSQAALRHYTAQVPRSRVETVTRQLLQVLKQPSANRRVLPLAQEIYSWLIRPIAPDLANSNVKTLVFVLDGVLRNIPMSVLHDGEQYLVEQYALALTPGLQLLNSQPLQQQQINVLLGGLSEPRQGFSALPNVIKEITEIQAEVPSQELLNQEFTQSALQAAISSVPFPVVHLATHGNFSSQLENTYIITWDGRININQLNSLLQVSDLNRRRPIELLVLSACATAEGDDRAALGLAGVAVRAGARSTIASLWQVNDDATAQLMVRFYELLASQTVTKAEALRQAQLSMLQNAEAGYQAPYFWSPFVLVGNWL